MYPSIQPHKRLHLHVDTLSDGKKVKIYVECSGNSQGILVIYLHGGPGDHTVPRLRRLYDPKVYHIVLFDQRGSGQSRPLNHTEKNTTQDLIKDIECIRKYMNAEKMLVAGGSWGSSLAMLYAQAYPTRVSALILRGIYDLSKIDVLDQMYPEEKDKLKHLLRLKTTNQKEEDSKITKTLSTKTRKRKRLIKLLSSNDPMFVISKNTLKETFKESETLTVIGNHYDTNNYFVPKNTIYKNMYKIKHIPTIMVEGRYDMVTPMKMAYELSKKFKDCELMIVRGGHTAYEEEITKALVIASDKFKTKAYLR
jgi:proline iminopeptidase